MFCLQIKANVLPKSAPKDVSTAVGVGTSAVKVTPPSCIAPVNNESINATIPRRVRDPRLRKIEQDEGTLVRNKVPVMPATTTKDSKPAVTTVQVDYKVDKENGLYKTLFKARLIANVLTCVRIKYFVMVKYKIQSSVERIIDLPLLLFSFRVSVFLKIQTFKYEKDNLVMN